VTGKITDSQTHAVMFMLMSVCGVLDISPTWTFSPSDVFPRTFPPWVGHIPSTVIRVRTTIRFALGLVHFSFQLDILLNPVQDCSVGKKCPIQGGKCATVHQGEMSYIPVWLAQSVKTLDAPTHVRSCVQEVRVRCSVWTSSTLAHPSG